MTTKSQVQARVNRAVELFLDQKTNPGALSKVSTEHMVQGIAEYLLEEIKEYGFEEIEEKRTVDDFLTDG